MIKGKCGKNAFYELNEETGHLIISGTGAIRSYAFDGCGSGYDDDDDVNKKALASKINTVVIEEGITKIGIYAFFECKNLVIVTIPNSVTHIEMGAFRCCENLVNIVIPDSVINIGEQAFSFCSRLTNVTLPKYITSIREGMFYDCGNLLSITIPSNVTKIEYRAFEGCVNLTSITIPSNVTNIGGCVFFMTNLKTKKKAYKAFELRDGKISCRNYEYKEGEWSETLDNIEPCKRGYHYCDNLFSIPNYYRGEIDKDIAIYECEVGDIVISHVNKYITNRIKPVKRLYREDVIRILNGGE